MNSINENLKNVYAEIWEILKYLNIEDVMKIPEKALKKIRENKNDNWSFKYNIDFCLDEQNIMDDTKNYFALLYYNYCCTDEEKKDTLKKWMNNG